jgi:hypothetical protein
MAEVKTAPLQAAHVADKETFLRDRIAGSFRVGPQDSDGELSFWYCCPCGCGAVAPLLSGNGMKPSDSPSWNWNGSTDAPTLHPSVNHVGHWHGWLVDGIWKSC